MIVDYILLAGIFLVGYLSWRNYQDIEEIGDVVAGMLIDLGKQGVLKVEVEDDGS